MFCLQNMVIFLYRKLLNLAEVFLSRTLCVYMMDNKKRIFHWAIKCLAYFYIYANSLGVASLLSYQSAKQNLIKLSLANFFHSLFTPGRITYFGWFYCIQIVHIMYTNVFIVWYILWWRNNSFWNLKHALYFLYRISFHSIQYHFNIHNAIPYVLLL